MAIPAISPSYPANSNQQIDVAKKLQAALHRNATNRTSEAFDLAQKIGQTGGYNRIVSFDDSSGSGVSINSGDSIPDVDHQELGARLVEGLINPGKDRDDPGFKTVERMSLASQKMTASDTTGLVALTDKLLDSAPKRSGQTDLSTVAVYIPVYLRETTPAERGAIEKLIAAKADVYVGEGNSEHGANSLLRIPGVIGVGGSDGLIGANVNNTDVSKINPWVGMGDGINKNYVDVVVNSRLKFVPIKQNEVLKGWDATGDGKVDFEAALRKSNAALASQFTGKAVEQIKVSLPELKKLEKEFADSYNKISHEYKDDPFTANEVLNAMREDFVSQKKLADKVVSVKDLEAMGSGYLNGSYLVGEHAPSNIDSSKVFVGLGAVFGGDSHTRYRDDLVFFTAGESGKLQVLGDNLTANAPSANSWATPNSVANVFLGKPKLGN